MVKIANILQQSILHHNNSPEENIEKHIFKTRSIIV